MKELLIQTAERTGLLDAKQLAEYLSGNEGVGRLDEVLLRCPYFTEEMVLKLFAEVLGWEFLLEVPASAVPAEFIEAIPATYAQHHYLIGIKRKIDNGELTVVLSRPLDSNALDNVSKMTGMPVKAAISTRTAITSAIDIAYEQRSTVIESSSSATSSITVDRCSYAMSIADVIAVRVAIAAFTGIPVILETLSSALESKGRDKTTISSPLSILRLIPMR